MKRRWLIASLLSTWIVWVLSLNGCGSAAQTADAGNDSGVQVDGGRVNADAGADGG